MKRKILSVLAAALFLTVAGCAWAFYPETEECYYYDANNQASCFPVLYDDYSRPYYYDNHGATILIFDRGRIEYHRRNWNDNHSDYNNHNNHNDHHDHHDSGDHGGHHRH
jgi:hypothetical protein